MWSAGHLVNVKTGRGEEFRDAHPALDRRPLRRGRRPFRREFATLSAWRDRESLDAMVRTEPHRSVMARYHAPEAYPPTWDEAERELA